MKVVVTDADQPGTPHTKIRYQIASESNPDGLFYINSQTGEVMVQQSTLDREVSDPFQDTGGRWMREDGNRCVVSPDVSL